MAKMGKYLYCFIKESEKMHFGTSEIGGLNAPVYNIPVNGVSAVVSDAPVIEYDPVRKNLLAHQKVIGRVMEKYSVVPVSFATVAGSRGDVEKVIDMYCDQLKETLSRLEGKVELGLKVTWSKEYFNKDIENSEITILKNKIAGKTEDEVLKDKIHLGQLVENAVLSKREDYVSKIYDLLSEIADDSRLSDKLSVKSVFNASFLVDKCRGSEFDRKVEEMANIFKGMLDFSYTGPWPPYNFVNIKISMH